MTEKNNLRDLTAPPPLKRMRGDNGTTLNRSASGNGSSGLRGTTAGGHHIHPQHAASLASLQEEDDGNSDSEYDDELDIELVSKTDTQCAICDDGGDLLICEGTCMRGFHHGSDLPACKSLGGFCLDIPQDLSNYLTSCRDPFKCPNCLAGTHQCFICKEEGQAGTEEVVRCMIASCGRYYHLDCLKKLNSSCIKEDDVVICPHHTCSGCGHQDQEKLGELVTCRRCPTAYHRGCIPPKLRQSKQRRVWYADFDDQGSLLPGCQVERSLIYCEKHTIGKSGVARHTKPLFSQGLLDQFKLYYAQQCPHLESSKKILKAHQEDSEEEEDKVDRAAGGKQKLKKQKQEEKAQRRHEQQQQPQQIEPGGEFDLEFGHGIPIKPLTDKEAAKTAGDLFRSAKASINKEDIKQQTRRPVPYATASKKTIEESRLQMLLRSFSYAQDQKSRGDRDWTNTIDKRLTVEIMQCHNDVLTALNPFLHGDRYSSYGRHFTSQRLLSVVVGRLMPFVCNGDRVIDFSCGANEFVPMMKSRALEDGVAVFGRSYDIIVAKDDRDFVLKSWFDTKKEVENLGPSEQLIIGLNPPFGKNNILANKFVSHAAFEFRPRVIVLIVPPTTKIPQDYLVVFEDKSLCRGEEFYVPGSSHKSWNKTPPVFRIMVRRDMVELLNDAKDWEKVPLY